MGKFVNQITPLHNSGLKNRKRSGNLENYRTFFVKDQKIYVFFQFFFQNSIQQKKNKFKSFNFNFRTQCFWLIDSWKKAVQTKNNFIRIEKKERKKLDLDICNLHIIQIKSLYYITKKINAI